MMWSVDFLDKKVVEELLSLPSDMKAHFQHIVKLIEEFGPIRIGMPHIKSLGKKLFEIRIKGKDGIARAIFVTVTGKKLVVLRVFIKKTQTTPKKELDIALARMKELKL